MVCFLEFCDRVGIALFPWQREAFGMAASREGSRFRYPLSGVSVPRGNGKSLGSAAVGVWRLRLARRSNRMHRRVGHLQGRTQDSDAE